jgi:4-amino-4-deoxy-L-arabinose transferase-like glycosyltransferase
VPVVIVWLICVHRAITSEDRRWSFAAGVCLGAGVYTYLASVIVMPLLALATLIVMVRHSRRSHVPALMTGFAISLLPLAAWLIVHPDRFTNLAAAYQPSDLTTMAGLRERVTTYWMFFNPDYLFISGDGRMTNSTRAAGLLPIAFAVFVPVGIYRLIRSGDGIGTLVVAGILVSPLPTAISGHLEINRVLSIIPFAALAAAAGARELLASRGAIKIAGILLALGVMLQFVGFYRHYHGDYRAASASWFGGDNRAAVTAVLDRLTPATPQVYLDGGTPIERYWRFYAVALGRPDQVERPQYFNGDTFDFSAAAGSLLVCESSRARCQSLERDGRWQLIASATLPDGAVTHRVYVRLP